MREFLSSYQLNNIEILQRYRIDIAMGLLDLPDDILFNIASTLAIPDVLALTQVSHNPAISSTRATHRTRRHVVSYTPSEAQTTSGTGLSNRPSSRSTSPRIHRPRSSAVRICSGSLFEPSVFKSTGGARTRASRAQPR